MSQSKLHDSLLEVTAAEAAVRLLDAALAEAAEVLGTREEPPKDRSFTPRAFGLRLEGLRILLETLGPHLVRAPRHRHLVRLRRLESEFSALLDLDWARARVETLLPTLSAVERPGGEWLRERLRRSAREIEPAILERCRRLLRKLRRRVAHGGRVQPLLGPVPRAVDVLDAAITAQLAEVLPAGDSLEAERNGSSGEGLASARGIRELEVLLELLPEGFPSRIPFEWARAVSVLLREQQQLSALVQFVKREFDRLSVARNASATVLPGLRGAADRLGEQCRKLRVGIDETVQGSADRRTPGTNGHVSVRCAEPELPELVERCFRLRALPPALRDSRSGSVVVVDEEIGLLPTCEFTEWVRREEIRSSDGRKVRHLRRIELDRDGERSTVEEEIARDLHESLLVLCGDARIDRRTFRLEEDADAWSVEQYLDRDLFLARLRGPLELELPDWIRDLVVDEISGQEEWTERFLARDRRARAAAAHRR